MIPWFTILFRHLRFRKLQPEEVKNHPFKMPVGAFANYLTIAFLILVLVGMLINKETVVSVVIGIVLLSAVTFYYLISYKKKDHQEKVQK